MSCSSGAIKIGWVSVSCGGTNSSTQLLKAGVRVGSAGVGEGVEVIAGVGVKVGGGCVGRVMGMKVGVGWVSTGLARSQATSGRRITHRTDIGFIEPMLPQPPVFVYL
jgi:hypothetical protein